MSPGGCFEQISTRKAIQKGFKKFPRKHPWSLKKIFFNDVADSITKTLEKRKSVILTGMFSYKFWEFFRTTFSLKTLCYYLWMVYIYSVKIHLQNTSKTLPKICDECSQYAEKHLDVWQDSNTPRISDNLL